MNFTLSHRQTLHWMCNFCKKVVSLRSNLPPPLAATVTATAYHAPHELSPCNGFVECFEVLATVIVVFVIVRKTEFTYQVGFCHLP